MEGIAAATQVFWSLILIGVCLLFKKLWDAMWLKPRRIRLTLSRQGIRGPKPSFLYGNIQEMQNIQSMLIKDQASEFHSQPAVSHNSWVTSIFPYLHLWAQQYGKFSHLFSCYFLGIQSDLEEEEGKNLGLRVKNKIFIYLRFDPRITVKIGSEPTRVASYHYFLLLFFKNGSHLFF